MSRFARSEWTPATDATDAAVVRAMYRALGERGVPALASYADPEIKWVHPMVTRLPFDGTRHGLTAVLRSAFRRDADGTGPRVSAETFVEFGDGVLVAGRFIGGQVMEDQSDEAPFLHECFVRGGRVALIREYLAASERGG